MFCPELEERSEDGRHGHTYGGCKGFDDGPEHELELVFEVFEKGLVGAVDGVNAEGGKRDGDDAKAIHGENLDCQN